MPTEPNALCAELHNRMQAVLGRKTWPAWLGEEPADARQLKAMLAPYPSDEMTCWPIGTRVSSVKNKDPSLIEPIAVQWTPWMTCRALGPIGGCVQAATERGIRYPRLSIQ